MAAARAAWWRWAGAILLLALALHSARVAVVRAETATNPAQALALWPDHPSALFGTGLASIGSAARDGKSPGPEVLRLIEHGALNAPLAPEPLWIAAAARMEVGDLQASERLLETAIRLDPRAPAARFLLADVSLRQGRLDRALDQVAALDRRLPGMSAGFTPALVRFLRQPGSEGQVGAALARNPALRTALLSALATDPDEKSSLLALVRPGDEKAPWFGSALERWLAQGDLASARQLHARAVPGSKLGGGLRPWRAALTADPFEWRFPSARGGVAEPVEGGALRLIHYGREETPLAVHLLALPTGRYRMSQRFAAEVPPDTLEWRLTCLPGERPAGQLPAVRQGAGGLVVPSGCEVQKLALLGRPGEVVATVRAELLEVGLSPETETSP